MCVCGGGEVTVDYLYFDWSWYFSPAVNKNDFRGYYGMGHVYEMLEMPHYALYYYKEAHRLRYDVIGIVV